MYEADFAGVGYEIDDESLYNCVAKEATKTVQTTAKAVAYTRFGGRIWVVAVRITNLGAMETPGRVGVLAHPSDC